MTATRRLAPLTALTLALGLWAAPTAVAQQAPACEVYSGSCAPGGGPIGGGGGGPSQLPPPDRNQGGGQLPAPGQVGGGSGGAGELPAPEQIGGSNDGAAQLPVPQQVGGGGAGATVDRPGALPFTGQDLTLAFLVGATATGAGAIVLVAARRRRA